MFSKPAQAFVGSLVFLSTVNGIVIPQQRNLISDLSSQGASYASSALSVASTDVASALSVWSTASPSVMSEVSSVVSSALSDASSYWSSVTDANGAQETGLVAYLAVVNGVTVTEVSSTDGQVITLAPSGNGVVTKFGGGVFTAATAAPSPASSSPGSGSGSSSTSVGFKNAVPSLFMGVAAFYALLVL